MSEHDKPEDDSDDVEEIAVTIRREATLAEIDRELEWLAEGRTRGWTVRLACVEGTEEGPFLGVRPRGHVVIAGRGCVAVAPLAPIEVRLIRRGRVSSNPRADVAADPRAALREELVDGLLLSQLERLQVAREWGLAALRLDSRSRKLMGVA